MRCSRRECGENGKIEGLGGASARRVICRAWCAAERNSSRKTQEDQYRQKLEDVFSGQEPDAKISRHVNS